MILAERKPIEEILEAVEGARRVLVAGCGTCVAVCLAGGEKEVGVLAAELRMTSKLCGKELEVEEATVQRQCEPEFLDEIGEQVARADIVLSLGCGAGTQLLAERFAPVRVTPGVNTKAIGVSQEQGEWAEYCQACGECLLDLTGGICPIARCSKGLLNGPCGGSENGRCEVDPSVDCAWQLIYDRLKAQGRLDLLDRIIEARDWRPSHHGGPRSLTHEEQRI